MWELESACAVKKRTRPLGYNIWSFVMQLNCINLNPGAVVHARERQNYISCECVRVLSKWLSADWAGWWWWSIVGISPSTTTTTGGSTARAPHRVYIHSRSSTLRSLRIVFVFIYCRCFSISLSIRIRNCFHC